MFKTPENKIHPTHFEKHEVINWSSLSVKPLTSAVVTEDKKKKTKTVRYELPGGVDLLTATTLYYVLPARKIKRDFAKNYRFAWVEYHGFKITPRATCGTKFTTFHNKTTTSSLFLSNYFLEKGFRDEYYKEIGNASEITDFSTEKPEHEITCLEMWTFSLDSGKAVPLFLYPEDVKPTLTYDFNLNVNKLILIQKYDEDKDQWINIPVTEEITKQIFEGEDEIVEPVLYGEFVDITNKERKARSMDRTFHITDVFEVSRKNSKKPGKVVHLSLKHPGLTTAVMWGAENVSFDEQNYSKIYSDLHPTQGIGSSPFQHSSITQGDEKNYVFEELPPSLVSSIFINRHFSSPPHIKSLQGWSFVRSHESGIFYGGCFTKGCDTVLSCKLKESSSNTKYMVTACSIIIRRITVNADGRIEFPLEKGKEEKK